MHSGEDLFGSVYQKGEVIFRQGEPGDRLYIIQSGAVQVLQQDPESGHETVIAIREKDDFFGELALFDNDVRSATVIAIRETRLLPVTRAALLERVQREPQVALHFLKTLIVRIQEAAEKLGDDLPRPPAGEDGAEAQPALSPVDLAQIWNVDAEMVWVDAGQPIFAEGDPGDALYIVLEGAVELAGGQGEARRVSRVAGPGEFFGEWALITDRPRAAGAAAAAPTRLLPVRREAFAAQVKARPQLALYLIQSLAARLRAYSAWLANPESVIRVVPRGWQTLIRKQEKLKLAIVSLATCAGCSAVLLDDQILAGLMELAEITYCPMLIDQDHLPEADVVLVDGAVRLKEDQEKLEEARAKSRFLAAWGSCAVLGGIPAEANRFELDDLLAETFGQAGDVFAYYLSGERGVSPAAYQQQGVAMLRKAGHLDDYVKVDAYVPGCPPNPAHLLGLLGELSGREPARAQAVVCGQCPRKPTRDVPSGLAAYPRGDEPPAACYNSLGVFCLGFLTLGGCEAACTAHGLPCWGCRGPARIALKKLAEGDSYEEVVVQGIARRIKMEEAQARALVRQLRKQGHAPFQFDPSAAASLLRVR